jgi:hypothetical protein
MVIEKRTPTPGEIEVQRKASELAKAIAILLTNAERVEWMEQPPPGAKRSAFFVIPERFLVCWKKGGDTVVFIDLIQRVAPPPQPAELTTGREGGEQPY